MNIIDVISLMEAIGKKPNELINTSHGVMEVISCDGKNVTYILNNDGSMRSESIEDFLSRFGINE